MGVHVSEHGIRLEMTMRNEAPKSNRTIIFILLLLSISISVAGQNQDLHIVYIGDSITEGVQMDNPANDAPPAAATAYLQSYYTAGHIDFSNQGHSGYTTVDFLPGSEAFEQTELAATRLASKPGLLIFSIMLGTNDSAVTGPNGSPVSPGAYYSNLNSIIGTLIKDYSGCVIIVHHPTWYSPNTYNGAKYLQEGLDRLQSYFPMIEQLANTYQKRVVIGDTEAFNYFKENHVTALIPENGHEGIFYLHPNRAGAKTLGEFWAKAIYKNIEKK